MTETDIRRGCTSASNAHADLLCPGRHQAQAGIPEGPASEEAERGRKIHAALADSGNAGLLSSLTIDERQTFDACREDEKALLTQFFQGEVGTSQNSRVIREKRFWVKVPPDGVEHSGQADVIHRRGVRALIIDYKTRTADVADSPSNLQLRDLAVLVNGALIAAAIPMQEIGTAVVQPMVSRSPSICIYSTENLVRAMDEMFERVRQSNRVNAQRVPGEVQCKYCRAAVPGKCVEWQRWSSGAVMHVSNVFDVGFDAWTPEQRAIAVEAIKPAEDFLEKLKEYLKQGMAQNPDFVPGYALKPGAVRETIIKPQEVFQRFVGVGGTADTFMPCVTIGKGKLKEVLASVSDLKGQELNEALKALINGCVETKQNAPSIARKET